MSVKGSLKRYSKFAFSIADRTRTVVPGVVILLYHRVGGGSSLEVDLDPAVFEEQMAALAASQRVIPLGDALEHLSSGAAEPGEPRVVVTFDDGTADFTDVAVPIMVRHRVPATLYLATAFVEDGTMFPPNGKPTSWAALADACDTGLVDIGSHTHTHRLLDRLPGTDVVSELDRSTGLIEDRLGRTAPDFAYPKAVYGSPDARRAIRERFRSAAVAGTRPNPFGRTDPYRLARSPIQVSDGMHWFEQKAGGGMALEDTARRWLDKIRYARSTS